MWVLVAGGGGGTTGPGGCLKWKRKAIEQEPKGNLKMTLSLAPWRGDGWVE